MYIHLGDYVLNDRDIIGIFNLETTTTSPRGREFLNYAQKNGAVVSLSDELPQCYVLADGWLGIRSIFRSCPALPCAAERLGVKFAEKGGRSTEKRAMSVPKTAKPRSGQRVKMQLRPWCTKTNEKEQKGERKWQKKSSPAPMPKPLTDHEYNASEIQVLKGLEAVRKRPGMYIGSTGERGLHHLVYEIVDNAIDEALAGYCDHIEVKILKDDIIQVTDNGRGIPVDIQADTGLPAVTVVYTILHAGGKFGGENSGYKVAGGLHGVGASVVNACSEWLTVNVRRDGHLRADLPPRRPGRPAEVHRHGGTEGVTGTRVTFKPDPEMFEDTTVYDFDTLEKRLREKAS